MKSSTERSGRGGSRPFHGDGDGRHARRNLSVVAAPPLHAPFPRSPLCSPLSPLRSPAPATVKVNDPAAVKVNDPNWPPPEMGHQAASHSEDPTGRRVLHPRQVPRVLLHKDAAASEPHKCSPGRRVLFSSFPVMEEGGIIRH